MDWTEKQWKIEKKKIENKMKYNKTKPKIVVLKRNQTNGFENVVFFSPHTYIWLCEHWKPTRKIECIEAL